MPTELERVVVWKQNDSVSCRASIGRVHLYARTLPDPEGHEWRAAFSSTPGIPQARHATTRHDWGSVELGGWARSYEDAQECARQAALRIFHFVEGH